MQPRTFEKAFRASIGHRATKVKFLFTCHCAPRTFSIKRRYHFGTVNGIKITTTAAAAASSSSVGIRAIAKQLYQAYLRQSLFWTLPRRFLLVARSRWYRRVDKRASRFLKARDLYYLLLGTVVTRVSQLTMHW